MINVESSLAVHIESAHHYLVSSKLTTVSVQAVGLCSYRFLGLSNLCSYKEQFNWQRL